MTCNSEIRGTTDKVVQLIIDPSDDRQYEVPSPAAFEEHPWNEENSEDGRHGNTHDAGPKESKSSLRKQRTPKRFSEYVEKHPFVREQYSSVPLVICKWDLARRNHFIYKWNLARRKKIISRWNRARRKDRIRDRPRREGLLQKPLASDQAAFRRCRRVDPSLKFRQENRKKRMFSKAQPYSLPFPSGSSNEWSATHLERGKKPSKLRHRRRCSRQATVSSRPASDFGKLVSEKTTKMLRNGGGCGQKNKSVVGRTYRRSQTCSLSDCKTDEHGYSKKYATLSSSNNNHRIPSNLNIPDRGSEIAEDATNGSSYPSSFTATEKIHGQRVKVHPPFHQGLQSMIPRNKRNESPPSKHLSVTPKSSCNSNASHSRPPNPVKRRNPRRSSVVQSELARLLQDLNGDIKIINTTKPCVDNAAPKTRRLKLRKKHALYNALKRGRGRPPKMRVVKSNEHLMRPANHKLLRSKGDTIRSSRLVKFQEKHPTNMRRPRGRPPKIQKIKSYQRQLEADVPPPPKRRGRPRKMKMMESEKLDRVPGRLQTVQKAQDLEAVSKRKRGRPSKMKIILEQTIEKHRKSGENFQNPENTSNRKRVLIKIEEGIFQKSESKRPIPETIQKRKRGRPRKIKMDEEKTKDRIEKSEEKFKGQETMLKRKRGRPRKIKMDEEKTKDIIEKSEEEKIQHLETVLKRKRGRPRKIKMDEEKTEDITEAPEEKEIQHLETVLKRKRGRPRKIKMDEEKTEEPLQKSEDEKIQYPETTLKRKRGRPRKIEMIKSENFGENSMQRSDNGMKTSDKEFFQHPEADQEESLLGNSVIKCEQFDEQQLESRLQTSGENNVKHQGIAALPPDTDFECLKDIKSENTDDDVQLLEN